jgi:hypothetical protein
LMLLSAALLWLLIQPHVSIAWDLLDPPNDLAMFEESKQIYLLSIE